jgi:hypothetical protein
MTVLFLSILFLTIGSNDSFSPPPPDLLIHSNDTLYVHLSPFSFFQDSEDDFVIKQGVIEDNYIINEGDIADAYYEYTSVWRIIDNKLYLTEIRDSFNGNDYKTADLKRLFKEKYSDGKVFADWISKDVLARVGFPKLRKGYLGFYEQEIEFNFYEGNVVASIEYNNIGIKVSKFNASHYRELTDYVYNSISWNDLPELGEEDIVVEVRFSSNKKGNVDDIQITDTDDQRFNEEVIRAVKTIPELCVAYSKGELVNLYFGVIIRFNETNKKKYAR